MDAFLSAVEVGRLVVLDLQSDSTPQFDRLNGFAGQPFIWCLLNNYGGVSGHYGRIPSMLSAGPPTVRRQYANFAGVGLAPEGGIGLNDAVYELAHELSLRPEVESIEQWMMRFISRRYQGEAVSLSGGELRMAVEANRLLLNSVWNCTVSHSWFVPISNLQRKC